MGSGSVSLPVPAVPALAGLPVFAQWAVGDPAGPFAGLTLTGGLKIVVNVN
jgi:hypothetical protein